jgi:hypothetical protein
MRAKNVYTIPISRELLQRIDRSSPAHVGKLQNAVDFIAPKGTPVLAAADGVVTHIKDDSNVGGLDVSYWFYTILLQSNIQMENILDMTILITTALRSN